MALPIRAGPTRSASLHAVPLVFRSATFAGYRTRVLELAGAGLPVLFFHGYGDSADTWRSAMELLGRQGHAAIAVDLPGFGEADRLRRQLILPQLDAFGQAALEYVARQSGGPVVVAGNSLGGCMALRLAERVDAPLAGIVAVAPAGLDMGRWLSIIEGEYMLRALLTSRAPIPHAIVQDVIRRMYRVLAFADSRAVTDEAVTRFAAHYRDIRTVRRYLAVARAMMRELRDPFALEKITFPVMVIWGTRDRLAYPSGAERVKAAVLGTRIELIEGCGHCPQIEACDRFVELLTDFHAGITRALRRK
jgi:pimeloyl-ACP methyl ester carboxylesterase